MFGDGESRARVSALVFGRNVASHQAAQGGRAAGGGLASLCVSSRASVWHCGGAAAR
jgi:hypothetical protein